MKPARAGCIFGIAVWLAQAIGLPSACGQGGQPEDAKKRKPAIVVFVNGCETPLSERWKASLDFRIGDKLVAGDIRIGERSPAILLSRAEAGKVMVFPHSGTKAIASARIPFEPDGHYVVVASGGLAASPVGVDVHIVSETGTLPGQIGSRARVVLFNTIKSYPVAVALGASKPQTIAPLTETVLWEAPGEQGIEIYFPYLKNERRAIRSSLVTEAGNSYLLVLHTSVERGDRPAITRTSSAIDRRDIEAIKQAVEEAEDKPGSASPSAP